MSPATAGGSGGPWPYGDLGSGALALERQGVAGEVVARVCAGLQQCSPIQPAEAFRAS